MCQHIPMSVSIPHSYREWLVPLNIFSIVLISVQEFQFFFVVWSMEYINSQMSLCMHVVFEVSREKSSYSIVWSVVYQIWTTCFVFSDTFSPLLFSVHFHKHEYDLPVFQFNIKTDRFQAVSIKYSSSSQLIASCKV